MDISQQYDSSEHVMFGTVKLTEKGCRAMIEMMADQGRITELQQSMLRSERKCYFDPEGNIKPDSEIVQAVAMMVMERQLFQEEWFNQWAKENFPEDFDFEDRVAYREKCAQFLRQTGYFLESEIEKVLPRLGGFRMGGQYTIRGALFDLLGAKGY